LESYGFSVEKADWQWDGKNPALLWMYTMPEISKQYFHWGPKKTDRKEHINSFKKKWKGVKIKSKRYYVERTRKFTLPEKYLKSLLSKEFKNFKIKKVV